jgi:hypothetical protein
LVAKRSARGGTVLGFVPTAELKRCPLCDRQIIPGRSADLHHLVPRSKGGKTAELVHRACHTKIHATLSETELAREFNNWPALRAQPDIAVFVAWLQGKPLEFYDKSRKIKSRKRG